MLGSFAPATGPGSWALLALALIKLWPLWLALAGVVAAVWLARKD